MPPKDAEMPKQQGLGDDLQEISERMSTLKHAVENLANSVGRAGSHQATRMQSKAGETLSAVEDTVKRDPITTLGIAAGIGLLLGILIRR
ncbi:MAG: hypothetical protein ACREDO_10895 [Methyloceanibacter sp.]